MDLTEDELKPGLILGRYELLAPVAKGGMAQVWVARLTGTRGFTKTVAIKTMLPNVSDDPQFEEMFLDEASLASRVRHPNAVEIMDLGEDAGILYLVMEWIEGEPLSIIMKSAAKKDGIPLPLAVRIVMQACAGLHAAHELRDDDGQPLGLVHRDVSPQNILVTYAGVVKVVDFGVAKATGRVSAETSAGQIKGKVPYMSPEQASGGDIDRRTDVFAMGILLYMMTTGKHPFRKDNEAQTLLAICSDAPVIPPSAFLPDYPSELEEILLKSLAKPLDDRYQSASDLQKALDGLPPEMRSSTEEELGDFMSGLLGERMEKRKGLIQSALKAADARAEGRKSRMSAVDLMSDERSSTQLTPMSGISRLSNVEGMAAIRGQPAPLGFDREQSTSAVATAVSTRTPTKNKAPAIIGGLALGAAAALGIYAMLNRGGENVEGDATVRAAAQPVETAAPSPAAAPETPSAEVLQVDDLKTAEEPELEVVQEIDLDAVDPGGSADKSKKSATAAAKSRRAHRAAPKSAPKPAAAPVPAPAPAPASAPAPAPKAGKPFISPFADPDF